MANFNMSKLSLDKNGNYRDVNGNIITQKGQALSGSAWKYLANKYGKDYANNASAQTRKGNIYQNGRWEPIQKNNSQTENKATSWGGKILQGIGDITGLYKMSGSKADLFGTGLYFVPGVQNALSFGDMIGNISKGEWDEAAQNAAFSIPFIGNIGRAAKVGLQTAKFAKAANKVDRGVNTISKLNKPANWFLNAKLLYDVPEMGGDLYKGYQTISSAKDELKPIRDVVNIARKKGMQQTDIDNMFKSVYGDNYQQIKTMLARDNTLYGNLGTFWDLTKQGL